MKDAIRFQAQEVLNRAFNEDKDAFEFLIKNPNGTLVDQSGKKTIVDESVAGTIYIGKAVPGTLTELALWQIQRIVEASGITTITWADGNIEEDNIWDDRTSLPYA